MGRKKSFHAQRGKHGPPNGDWSGQFRCRVSHTDGKFSPKPHPYKPSHTHPLTNTYTHTHTIPHPPARANQPTLTRSEIPPHPPTPTPTNPYTRTGQPSQQPKPENNSRLSSPPFATSASGRTSSDPRSWATPATSRLHRTSRAGRRGSPGAPRVSSTAASSAPPSPSPCARRFLPTRSGLSTQTRTTTTNKNTLQCRHAPSQ